MKILDLPFSISTQIAQPETLERFYSELLPLSGAMANLGEDCRILQGSMFGEITSVSSSSSAMAHKAGNPIAAENVAGMHVTVIAEVMKVQMSLVSDLQRDLRGSNVMRSFSAAMVYTFQQIKTTQRLLKSLKADEKRCRENYLRDAKLLAGENFHLFLQREGVPDSHKLVNKVLVPEAIANGINLYDAAVLSGKVDKYLAKTPLKLKKNMMGIEPCLGESIQIAEAELHNKLEPLTV